MRTDRRISMRLTAVLAGRVTDVAFRGRGYEHAIDINGTTRLTGVLADVRAARGARSSACAWIRPAVTCSRPSSKDFLRTDRGACRGYIRTSRNTVRLGTYLR